MWAAQDRKKNTSQLIMGKLISHLTKTSINFNMLINMYPRHDMTASIPPKEYICNPVQSEGETSDKLQLKHILQNAWVNQYPQNFQDSLKVRTTEKLSVKWIL